MVGWQLRLARASRFSRFPRVSRFPRFSSFPRVSRPSRIPRLSSFPRFSRPSRIFLAHLAVHFFVGGFTLFTSPVNEVMCLAFSSP